METNEPQTESAKTPSTAEVPRAGRQSVLELIDSARKRINEPTESAVEHPESAPEAPEPSHQTPEPSAETHPEPERAEELPESLTGEESDEELTNLGYNKPATHDRIRNLARERNEAKQQLAALQAQLLEQQAQGAASPKKQQLTEDDWKFNPKEWEQNNPKPDEDDYEASQRWDMRREAAKEAHELSVRQLSKFAEALAPQFAEVRQQEAKRRYEGEWKSLEGDLTGFETSRDEMEPAVLEIIRQHPQHSVESALYIAMKYAGVLGGRKPSSPSVPSVTKPGQGRASDPVSQPDPPRGPQTVAEQREALFEQMAEFTKSGESHGVGKQAKAAQLRSALIDTIRQRQ